MVRTEEELLKEYYHSLSAEAEEVAELKLNTAIRRGITRSRRSSMSLRKRYALGIAAVLAFVLLFSFPWAGRMLKPQGAVMHTGAMNQNNLKFEKYLTNVWSNTTVSSAVDAGLVQRISGVTAEQNGLVLTVDGIAADRKGIILLYSLQNNTNKNVAVNSMQLTGSSMNSLHSSRGPGVSNTPNSITYGYEVRQWESDYSSLPDQIKFELELGENKQFTSASADAPPPSCL